MKHFFLLLGVCVVGYLLAPSVLGIKSKSAEPYINEGVYSSADTPLYTRKMGGRNHMNCQTSLTIMLDLNEVETVKEPEELVTIVGSSKEFGLFLTKEGLAGNWGGELWGANKALSLSRLLEHPGSVRIKDRDYLALTVLVNGAREVTSPGVTVVDSSGEVLLEYPALNTALNEHYSSVKFSQRCISHVMIAPKLLSLKAAGKRAVRMEKTVSVKPGNAMVAFGGGGVVLLVLAALWSKVRKRRSVDKEFPLQSLS